MEETDVHLSSHLQLLGDRIIHTRDLNTAICISQRPALAPLHPGLPISALAVWCNYPVTADRRSKGVVDYHARRCGAAKVPPPGPDQLLPSYSQLSTGLVAEPGLRSSPATSGRLRISRTGPGPRAR